MSLRKASIEDYMSKINFITDNWSLSQIKSDMRRFLGEEPGIQIKYKKDVMINEIKGESQEFEKVDNVEIVFTDDDDKIRKITFKM